MGTRDGVQCWAYNRVKNFNSVHHMSMYNIPLNVFNCRINHSLACSKCLVSDMYFWTHLDMATFEDNGKVSSPNKSTFRVTVVY